MLVVHNPRAQGGRVNRRWGTACAALRQRYPDAEVITPAGAAPAREAVHAGLRSGHRTVIAAGGDGTVNLVLNALMDPATDRPRAERVCLGAIGLGSSNDFHKPRTPGRTLAGLPARIDVSGARRVDVGKATISLADGTHCVRYFLLNASLGVVADGNHLFSTPGRRLAWLKRHSVGLAITACSIQAITRSTATRVAVHTQGWSYCGEVANIGVLKSGHFAGRMRYDTGVSADDGCFDVAIWRPAGPLSLTRTVIALCGGRLPESAVRARRRTPSVTVTPERPGPLELDGEVVTIAAVRFDVLPSAVTVCA